MCTYKCTSTYLSSKYTIMTHFALLLVKFAHADTWFKQIIKIEGWFYKLYAIIHDQTKCNLFNRVILLNFE